MGMVTFVSIIGSIGGAGILAVVFLLLFSFKRPAKPQAPPAEEGGEAPAEPEAQEPAAEAEPEPEPEAEPAEEYVAEEVGQESVSEAAEEPAEPEEEPEEPAEPEEEPEEEPAEIAEPEEEPAEIAEIEEETVPTEEVAVAAADIRINQRERKDMVTEQDIKQFSQQCTQIFKQIARDVIGQEKVVQGTVIAMIAGGNVLLEGVPGVGKTRLVRTLGRVFDLPFSRIQFTPDLMPADVTGTNIIVKDESGNSQFSFQPGPIFSNIILADEINRATPKTQSALLEAMQEHTVTVMGVSRRLAEPFFVLATQNPIEQDGTYPLPEAQMDRFMFKLLVPDPSLNELMQIVSMTQKTMEEVAEKACTGDELLRMRKTANQIPVAEDVLKYAMVLVAATHPEGECATEAAKKYIRVGASPRAGQAIISASKVLALIKGRYNVSYYDLYEMAYPVLRHRIKLNFEAIAERISADDVITMVLEEVEKKYHKRIMEGKPLAESDAVHAERAEAQEAPAVEQEVSAEAPAEAAAEEAEAPVGQEEGKKKAKRGFFGRK